MVFFDRDRSSPEEPRPPTPTLDPKPGVWGPKQGLENIYSLNRETRQKFHKTKLVGMDCFSGGGSYFWARNPDPEGPGPHVLSGKGYKTKVIMHLPFILTRGRGPKWAQGNFVALSLIHI